jgi:hypothetical protein
MSTEIPDEVIERLKSANGPGQCIVLGNDDGVAAFRAPSAAEYQFFVDSIAKDETKGTALKALVMACRVYPDQAEFLSMVNRRPALVQVFGNELVEFAGLKRITLRKVL